MLGGQTGVDMIHRGNLFAEELAIRSRLAKLIHRQLFVYGSMTTSKRRCGKDNCWCKQEAEGGHVSSYLSVRVGKKRKLVFVPQSMVKEVKQWIEAYKEINKSMIRITEICIQRLKG